MSFFVTRPPAPLPAMLRTSIRCSRAILRTTGDNLSSRASAADHGRDKVAPEGGASGAEAATRGAGAAGAATFRAGGAAGAEGTGGGAAAGLPADLSTEALLGAE